jgi:hypothetical protein
LIGFQGVNNARHSLLDMIDLICKLKNSLSPEIALLELDFPHVFIQILYLLMQYCGDTGA